MVFITNPVFYLLQGRDQDSSRPQQRGGILQVLSSTDKPVNGILLKYMPTRRLVSKFPARSISDITDYKKTGKKKRG